MNMFLLLCVCGNKILDACFALLSVFFGVVFRFLYQHRRRAEACYFCIVQDVGRAKESIDLDVLIDLDAEVFTRSSHVLDRGFQYGTYVCFLKFFSGGNIETFFLGNMAFPPSFPCEKESAVFLILLLVSTLHPSDQGSSEEFHRCGACARVCVLALVRDCSSTQLPGSQLAMAHKGATDTPRPRAGPTATATRMGRASGGISVRVVSDVTAPFGDRCESNIFRRTMHILLGFLLLLLPRFKGVPCRFITPTPS